MRVGSVTPTARHLFDTAEDATKISQTDADLFHHFVAQLLYLSKRPRPERKLTVSLLCARLRDPDTDDYKNMSRVMKYIQVTIGITLIM